MKCPRPFLSAEITQHGEVRLCCPSWLPTSIGNIKDKDVWNSEIAIKIRKSILDENYEYCRYEFCPFLSSGINLEENPSENAINSIENNETKLSYGPEKVVACYDRSCSLHCKSCRSEVIMEDSQDLHNHFLRFIKDTKHLTLLGSGELFSSKVILNWLSNFDKTKFPKLNHICILSNGLLFNKPNWEKIMPVQHLVKEIKISMDAVSKETYLLNREGGDFDTLINNLNFIKTLNIKTYLVFVVQKNNFFEMKEFVTFARKYNFHPTFILLDNWGTYSKEEYESRAVHLKTNPSFIKFKKTLNDPFFKGSDIYLSNLNQFID
jgi:hypothetical protein